MQPKRTGVIPINVAIHTVSVCITRFQFAGRTRPIVAPLSIAKRFATAPYWLICLIGERRDIPALRRCATSRRYNPLARRWRTTGLDSSRVTERRSDVT
jgi:hypothetical protein